jgi:hypothetical protein
MGLMPLRRPHTFVRQDTLVGLTEIIEDATILVMYQPGRRLTMQLRRVPTCLVTGAYILHAGIGKWGGGPEQAAGIHAMASGAFPMLKSIDPPKFLHALSGAEIATGLVILTPLVPAGLVGAALTGFSGGLMAMYPRTPSLRNAGSIWPSPQGIAVSKDIWMLVIGLGLLIDETVERRG